MWGRRSPAKASVTDAGLGGAVVVVVVGAAVVVVVVGTGFVVVLRGTDDDEVPAATGASPSPERTQATVTPAIRSTAAMTPAATRRPRWSWGRGPGVGAPSSVTLTTLRHVGWLPAAPTPAPHGRPTQAEEQGGPDHRGHGYERV